MPRMMILIAVGATLLFGFVIVLLVLKQCYRRLMPGQALVISSPNGRARVSFTGAIVLPIVNRADALDITTKTIAVEIDGADALICKDNVRAAVRASFYVKVRKTQEDVLKVAQAVGCERASHPQAVEELFRPKFVESLRAVARQRDYVELDKQVEQFRDEVIKLVGMDLHGFVLEDCAIEQVQRAAPLGGEQGPFR
jgi:uncharacterized membrane protein YqiK